MTESAVVLKHSSGASVKILKYGATVIEWTLANSTENLFLSKFLQSPSKLMAEQQNSTDQRLYVEESLLYHLLFICLLMK